MTATTAGTGYLKTDSAQRLHATFVANAEARMRELGWIYADNVPQHAGKPRIKLLADKSGLPFRTVENLMRLGHQPSLVGAAAVAQALGVRLDTLLGQENDFGPGVSSEGNGALVCVHTHAHTPNSQVCGSCLRAWQRFQARKRELWEAQRRTATDEATAREHQRRAEVRANGQDPDDVRR